MRSFYKLPSNFQCLIIRHFYVSQCMSSRNSCIPQFGTHCYRCRLFSRPLATKPWWGSAEIRHPRSIDGARASSCRYNYYSAVFHSEKWLFTVEMFSSVPLSHNLWYRKLPISKNVLGNASKVMTWPIFAQPWAKSLFKSVPNTGSTTARHS